MVDVDPIMRGDTNRFVLFPIRYPTLWEKYKISQRCFWTTEELDLTLDAQDWSQSLSDAERDMLSTVLAFFACSDGIVGENIAQQFFSEVCVPEARCFYGFQIMMENVHAETYARLVQELVGDEVTIRDIFAAVETFPAVKAKAEWCLKWFDRASYTFATRLVAFAIVEGVFFSSSFAAIFWVRTRGVLPGLCHSNELIMRDEGQHVEFACELYRLLYETVPPGVVHQMVREAVELEHAFFASAMPSDLRGLNARLMKEYVEYVADFLLARLRLAPLYNGSNPFPFMEASVFPGRANFFERGVSDYQSAPIG